jgi:predicted membrane protein
MSLPIIYKHLPIIHFILLLSIYFCNRIIRGINMEEHRGRVGGRLFVGAIFLIAGILFLLSNFDLVEFSIPRIIFSWQVILIIVGAIIIINSNDVAGYIMITIGTVFLLAKYYEFNAWDLWPVIFIVLGIYLVFNFRRQPGCHRENRISARFGGKGVELTEDLMDEVAIFGGGKKFITSKNFQGGRATAIFGGLELDLYEAQLAPGDQVIDVLAVFGGVSVHVPRDWKIIIKITPIFGGFSDERRRSPELESSSNKVLIIKGFVLFGGGEIKGA